MQFEEDVNEKKKFCYRKKSFSVNYLMILVNLKKNYVRWVLVYSIEIWVIKLQDMLDKFCAVAIILDLQVHFRPLLSIRRSFGISRFRNSYFVYPTSHTNEEKMSFLFLVYVP